jgi:hypothetical protein
LRTQRERFQARWLLPKIELRDEKNKRVRRVRRVRRVKRMGMRFTGRPAAASLIVAATPARGQASAWLERSLSSEAHYRKFRPRALALYPLRGLNALKSFFTSEK